MARRNLLLVALLLGAGCSSEPLGPAPDAGSTLPPAQLAYADNPAVYAVGVAVAPNPPRSGGGRVESYAVAPDLPAGLSLDPATGLISGTPSVAATEASYTVTAANAAGSATVGLRIAVRDGPPVGVTYATNPAIYRLGAEIAPNAPTAKGGAPTAWAIEPALPAGLALDPVTGTISGTPSEVAPRTRYTVRASNSEGSASVTLALTVNELPPEGLTYATNPATYVLGEAIAPNAPSSSGGAVVAYAVEPALPPGLTLDGSTGVVSGTPTALAPARDYAVAAANSGGLARATLGLAVVDLPPSDLQYAASPAVYRVGHPIEPNVPTSSGGTVTLYEVAPALPEGLTLHPTTGVLSGTPRAPAAEATYTVAASNSGGQAAFGLVLTLEDAPPAELSYAENPAVYLVGAAIAPNVPSSLGGVAASYSIAPAPPVGLTLDPETGVLSGTPSAAAEEAVYTVTAANPLGEATAELTLIVKDLPPTDLAYATSRARYVRLVAIAPNAPTLGGGGGVSYSVDPPLPAGLVLDPATGAISGTPAVLAEGTHTITATNSGGSTTAQVAITVISQTVVGIHEALAAGGDHTCALMGGGVQCWGSNLNGQLGDGSHRDSAVPVPVSGILGGAQALAAGASHTCAVVNGGAWCWGANFFGQLGDGTAIERTRPVPVAGLSSGVQAIAAGAYHTCAIVDGAAKCWGYNAVGQLGDGSWTDRHAPVAVVGRGAGTRLLAAGSYHTCAVGNGSLWCWGRNASGQLGDDTTTDRNRPVNAQALADFRLLRITAGGAFTCAQDQNTRCWGADDRGQLGRSLGGASWPLLRACGDAHVCQLDFSGNLSCFGANTEGQAGHPSLVDVKAPGSSDAYQVPLEAAQTVVAGRAHSCALVAGSVWCWGANQAGQLGDGTTTRSAAPVKVQGIAGGIASLVAGDSHACVLVNGQPWCWGANADYQLGRNVAGDVTAPALSARSNSGARALTAGTFHTCAEGTKIDCWGRNSSGQLGRGTVTAREYSVSGLGGSATRIVAGEAHTCRQSSSGQLECAGSNAYHQMHVAVSNGYFVTDNMAHGLFASGDNHLCELSRGAALCWGQNSSGQLGMGWPSPMEYLVVAYALREGAQEVFAGGANSCGVVDGVAKCWGALFGESARSVGGLSGGVRSVSMRTGHACALVNGGVRCVGANGVGQLGTGTQTDSPSSAVPVQGLDKDVLSVAVGGSFTCALVGGDVRCWGGNDRGQLGIGTKVGSLVPAAPALSR